MNGQRDRAGHTAIALLQQMLGARVIEQQAEPGITLADPDRPEYGLESSPEDVLGLRGVMGWVARKPSRRLNPLVILCPESHVLGKVYQTTSGLVLVGTSAARGLDHREYLTHPRGAARRAIAITLDATREPRESKHPRARPVSRFTLGCRCQYVELSVAEVNDLLNTPGCPRRVRIEVLHGEDRAAVALLPQGVRRHLRPEDESA